MQAPSPPPSEGVVHGRFVFVYGTLRKGERNDITRLLPAPRYIGAASLPGTLYHLGDYPGLLLPREPFASLSGRVAGEVYAMEAALEQRLDEIEGILPHDRGEYAKRQCVLDVAGQQFDCLVYEINPDQLQNRSVIAHGDWVRRNIFSQYENS